MKNAGGFMCMIKNDFSAKFGVIITTALGINKVKKISYDNACDFIKMIKEHEESKVFEQIKNFTIPEKLRNLMESE